MSKNNINTGLANHIRKRGYIVPVYLIIAVLFAGTVYRMYCDFMTSVYGVKLLNPASMGSTVEDYASIVSLAIAPQALTVVLSYVFLDLDWRKDRQSLFVKLGVLVFLIFIIAMDVWTGYMFYAQGGHPLFFSLVADTLFSELGWTLSFGLLVELKSDFWKQTQDKLLPRKHRPYGDRPTSALASNPVTQNAFPNIRRNRE